MKILPIPVSKWTIALAIYGAISLATFIFQIIIRLEQCASFGGCVLSIVKGVVWSVIWPLYWLAYHAGT